MIIQDQEDHQLKANFLEAMSHIASTVHVVTTDGPAGKSGITVTSMTSLSLDPPSLLVCIHKKNRMVKMIRTNERFGVNVLSEDQQSISEIFAGLRKPLESDLFTGADWQSSSLGCPRLMDALVYFDCEVLQVISGGSHYILIGEVKFASSHDASPLLYWRRNYGMQGS